MQFIYDKTDFNRYLYRHCHCCNAGQSKEERKMKYRLVLFFGKDSDYARKYRDWNRQPFAKKFGYSSWENMLKILEEIGSKGGDKTE